MPADSQTGPASTSSAAITNGVSPKEKKVQTEPLLASGAFRKLVSAVNECAKFQAIYNDIEGTRDRLSRLELEIATKNDQITAKDDEIAAKDKEIKDEKDGY